MFCIGSNSRGGIWKKKNRVSGIVDGPSLGDNGWSYVRVVGKFAFFFMSILSSVNMEL